MAIRLMVTDCAEQKSLLRAACFLIIKGRNLVNNLPGYAVALQRQGQRDNEKVIGILSEILNMPEDQIRKRIAANQNSYEQPA